MRIRVQETSGNKVVVVAMGITLFTLSMGCSQVWRGPLGLNPKRISRPEERAMVSEEPILIPAAPIPSAKEDLVLPSLSGIPAEASALYQKGLAAYREERFEEATQAFRKYLWTPYPDPTQEIQWRLAQSYLELDRLDEAVREFNKLIGSPNPENRADALLKLGIIDQKKGDLESAHVKWNRVVSTYPTAKAASMARSLLSGEAQGEK